MGTRKILIVDDEPDAVLLLEAFLSSKGFETLTALSGDEALAKIEQERPALVLLDVMMPNKNGFEVLREIRSNSPRTPVILVSAITDSEFGYRGLQLGAFDYVTKPVDLEYLEKAIRWKMAMD